MADSARGPFRLLRSLVKLASIVAGGVLTVVCLAALTGVFVGNVWIGLLIGLIVAIGLPLLIADRFLPDDPSSGRGIPTDILAISWVVIPLVFVVLGPITSDLLADEEARLEAIGWTTVGQYAHWMAGPTLDAEQAPSTLETTTSSPTASDGSGNVSEGTGDGALSHDELTPPVDPSQPTTANEDDLEQTYSPAEIFRQWAPSVVSIQTNRANGTGFILTSDGLVATNHHVIEDATRVNVKLIDGSWAQEVWLLTEDADLDLALLQIVVDQEMTSVVLGNSDEVEVGERTISIGNPLGLEHTLTDGLISARRVYDNQRYLQTSTPISPGNSGGPLFNMKGAVIGVSTATIGRWEAGQNLNLAVPVNELRNLISDDYPDRRFVGGSGERVGSW